MNKKMTLLAGAISSVLSGAALADINNIIISEYVEGGVSNYATNSAIEITNTGITDFTFNGDYALYFSSYKNKVVLPDGSTPVLDGVTVPANGSIVIINSDATDSLQSAISDNGITPIIAGSFSQVKYNALNFNGGEAVWIAKSADADDIHDIIGKNSDNWGANVTYRRTNDTLTPSAEFNSKGWVEHPVDTYDDLGKPTFEEPPLSTTPCTDAEGLSTKYIGEVQGTGYSSPLIAEGQYESEDEYLVRGTVSAIGTSLVKGFYLYDDNADGEVRSSDGIFVKTSGEVAESMIGQQVCVRAKVKEDYGMTTLIPTNNIWEVENTSQVAPTPVELVRIDSDDENFRSTLERLEGMPVKLVKDMDAAEEGEQNMRVSRSFSFDYSSYRNNMVLAYKRPNPQPNQDHVAGSDESYAQSAENKDFRIFVDSDAKAPNGQIPYYPDFFADPKNNYIRINDTVTGLEGVLHYSHKEFRLIPTNNVDKNAFTHNTDRTKAPEINETNDAYPATDSFSIKVATQNVLNYFNSPFGGSDNSFGDNRGAESQQEFERQQAKIVEAIYGLDADIVGLMEVENNGFGDFSAINELLAAINAKYYDEDYGDRNKQNSIHNRYVFVGFDKNGDTILDDQDTVGSDAITTGIIYRPSKVSVINGKVIPMPAQHAPMIVDENGTPLLDKKGELLESGDNYQRNTVAATFQVLNTGKRLTVAVNHLKSKGSTCWDDFEGTKAVDNDFQGSCENFRVAAAYHLGEELAKIGGDRVVLGDMNSYAKEDPMLVLTSNPTGKELKAAGYTFIGKQPQFGPEGKVITKTYGYLNAVDHMTAEGETSWSYSYNDEVGSLDHLLLSGSLEKRLVDAVDWHINAPESTLYDYNNRYKGGDENEPNPFYAQDPYRSSDHDSALVALGYKYGEAGEGLVTIATKSGRADIGFALPETALEGDIASLSISPQPATAPAFSQETLSKDGAQLVKFDAAKLPVGKYKLTMTLKRGEGEVVSSKTMEVSLVKRDSSNVKPVYPEKDGSGGSFGFGALLALLGLGAFRRCR
ncbi:ExeM/NucH family extracellular endonuclease [Vibrio sp. CAU 1672]|uniref:ExeM/NucH family extracellular endonuclease n=1 Tax=Vibrio sp. CAU 1672 TaxID=3032594 RepID=UPI0023DB5113|nr:ExeM/NucH family extracellular endonuclease [Vibrio sp. CAU 1672]MDF2154705.1 ExeM/NucH family extracellular endonuclease [Vibrio sp. CAU 1672]